MKMLSGFSFRHTALLGSLMLTAFCLLLVWYAFIVVSAQENVHSEHEHEELIETRNAPPPPLDNEPFPWKTQQQENQGEDRDNQFMGV